MLARSLLAWLVFSLLLLLLAYATQASEFDPEFIGWSLLLALPVGVSAYRGSLSRPGSGSLDYPSISICVLSAWILGVGPSLIVEAPESHLAFNFTAQGLAWARMLFLLWCLVFVVTAGAPDERRISARVSGPDFWGLAICSIAILGYLIELGLYSNYQGGTTRTTLESGSLASVCKAVGTLLTTLLPALCLLAYARAPSVTVKAAAAVCFLAALVAILLSTSRGALVVATMMCLSLSRKLGFRYRMSVMIGLAASLPILFALIIAYRQQLMESGEVATSIQSYVQTAAQSTNTIARDELARSDTVAALSTNMRMRLWYGPQFSASVDEWLDHGASMKGSLLAGIIRSAPVWIFPSKNELAEEYEFETLLIETGRFPVADLGPMPWQQWLFEFGIVGLILGAVLYGYFARLMERRLSSTGSVYEIAFWLGVFVTLCAPEHTTDSLILSARIIAAFLFAAFGVSLVMKIVLPAVGRRAPTDPVTGSVGTQT